MDQEFASKNFVSTGELSCGADPMACAYGCEETDVILYMHKKMVAIICSCIDHIKGIVYNDPLNRLNHIYWLI